MFNNTDKDVHPHVSIWCTLLTQESGLALLNFYTGTSVCSLSLCCHLLFWQLVHVPLTFLFSSLLAPSIGEDSPKSGNGDSSGSSTAAAHISLPQPGSSGPGLMGTIVGTALQFSIRLGSALAERKPLSGCKLVTCAKWIHSSTALEDHLVNYFHCTEYHPCVPDDGIVVTRVSYFFS